MSPARYPGFSRIIGRGRAGGTVATIAAAALIGTVVGGFSVLAVVVAVVQPPDQPLRADTGSSNAAAPAAIPATPTQSIASAPPQPTPPLPPQTSATQTSATQTSPTQTSPPQTPQEQQITWPDALTRRTLQERENAADKPDPSPSLQTPPAQRAAAPASEAPTPEQGAVDHAADRHEDRQDPRDAANKVQPAPGNHTVNSRASAAIRVTPLNSKRVATTPQATPPAPPDTDAAANAAPPDAPRLLFDLFSGFRDNRDTAAGPEDDTSRQPDGQQTRDTRGSARKLVRRQRQDGPDASDQAAPQSDHEQAGGGFFGGWHRDNWHQDNWHQDN